MQHRVFVGEFSHESNLLSAVREAQSTGMVLVDAYTPYPVKDLDMEMGLRKSRLPLICFLLAAVGGGFKVWFEFWTSAYDWPINVGGKPWNSLLAFLPVTFEILVLFAGVSTIIAFLFRRGLHPFKKQGSPIPRATDDTFVLVVRPQGMNPNPLSVRELLERNQALRVYERIEG